MRRPSAATRPPSSVTACPRRRACGSRGRQGHAEHDVHPRLLGDLPHGGGRDRQLAGVELSLGPRPVPVARAVHEGDLEAAIRARARRPPRRRARPAGHGGAAPGSRSPVAGRTATLPGDQVLLQVAQAAAPSAPVVAASRCRPGPGATTTCRSSMDRSMSSMQLGCVLRVADRDEGLDAAVEVAVHQVGRSDVDLRARPPFANAKTRACSRNRPRIERTRMVSLRPGTPGRSEQMPRTTQVDRDAGLRRPVQGVDDGLVDDRVHLDPDPRRPARAGGWRSRVRCVRSARSASTAARPAAG